MKSKTENVAEAVFNLYLVITDDIQDDGIDALAGAVASFVLDYGMPMENIDSDALADALRDVAAEYFGD